MAAGLDTSSLIRAATADDLSTLLGWCGKFHSASGLAAPFNKDDMRVFLERMIASEAATILMHESGMIGGLISSPYCNSGWKIAVELFWWSEKQGLPLLRAFEDWAASQSANEIRMTSLCTMPRAGAVLSARGFVPAEISHQKVISWH